MLPPGLEEELQQQSAPEGGILCSLCSTTVTGRDRRMEYRGRHAHTFENPAGFMFRIGLFRTARCRLEGPILLDYTWFPGYHWQTAFCESCGVQLGWHYAGGDGSFFGLILDRLILNE